MSAPARSSAWICSTVPLMSCVTVLVIDCTVIGASPPTGTLPTWIVRQARRVMSRYGRTLIGNLVDLALSAYRTLRLRKKDQLALDRGAGEREVGAERDIAAQR